MNILDEVVNQISVPNDSTEKFTHDTTLLSCAAATRTFKYMITSGLEYSVLTNGRIKVILRVLEADPATLYYSILEPSADTEPREEDGLGF